MKGLDDILLLGNPKLYQLSEPIQKEELPLVKGWARDLHEVMEAIRAEYGFGRAIAAPQLGIMKRLIYLNIDKPTVIINPEFTNLSEEMFELWDDCMSLPMLFVKVRRHRRVTMKFLNEQWEEQFWELEGDMSELLQHEYDHLDGVLCTMRAVDEKSFRWRNLKKSS